MKMMERLMFSHFRYLNIRAFIKFLAKWKYILAASAFAILILLTVSMLGQVSMISHPGQESNSSIQSNVTLGNFGYASFNYGLQIPYTTYQFASWGGGGWSFGQGVTDAQMQEQQAMATMILPWEGRAGWCSNANTSTNNINSLDPIYGSSISNTINKYQTPFLIQEPLDSYGTECVPWGEQVITQFPDLVTYDYNGTPLTASRMSIIGKDYVRVDSMNFAKQIYNDLVNIYSNMKSTNPGLVNYWYGIEVGPGIYADHGDLKKPGANIVLGYGFATDFYWSNQTILNFANSPQCTQHYSNCATLAAYASGGANTYTIATTIANNDAKWFGLWLDYELFLGLSYAAYNFTQNYQINHPFFIHASYDYYGVSLNPSSYPYPYNTPYIESLDLFNNFVMNGVLDYENGNPPSAVSVSYDEKVCSSHLNKQNTINGFLITGTYANVKNMVYLEAYCAGTSIMEPMNLPYNNPSNSMIQVLMDYGVLLNRMSYVGIGQNSVMIIANDATTGVTVLGGKGSPLLLWFYTNSSTGDTATINLNLGGYQIGQNGWIAVSALNWGVVGRGNSNTLTLTVNIPAQGWNPVYVINSTSVNFAPLYTNLHLISYNQSQNAASYLFSGPHALSGWAIIHTTSKPISVTASNSGQIQEYPSLQALNSTYVGMQWKGNSWQNLTQTGWYYDSLNQLLYVHFVGDRKVTLSIMSTTSTQSASLIISMPTTSLSLMQGANSSLMFDVYSINTASQLVTLSTWQIPASIHVQILPYSSYTNFSSTLYISVSNNTQPGSYYLTLEANSSTLFASIVLSLSIIAAQPSGQGSSGNGGTGSNQSDNNSVTDQNNNTGQTNNRLYTLTIISGPAGFGSTSPESGTYQMTAGTSVSITAIPVKGWNLGSWFVNGNYAGNGSSITVTVLSDTTVLAYFTESTSSLPSGTVSISTDVANTTAMIDGRKYVLPVSFSWPLGTVHNITVDSSVYSSDDELILLAGWTGIITSNSSSISIKVQGDSSVLVHHVILYKVELKFVDSRGMPVEPDMVQLLYNQGTLQLNKSFTFWAPAGMTYTFTGAKWEGTGLTAMNNSNTFTIISPGTVTIELNIHPQTFKVQDVFGQPIAGAEVSVQLPDGTEIKEITNSSGIAYFPQLPPLGYQTKVSYLGSTLSFYPNQQPGKIQYVTFALSYPVIGGFIAILASLGISLSFSKLKKMIIPNINEHQKDIKDQTTSEQ
jgi:hypothetical protein